MRPQGYKSPSWARAVMLPHYLEIWLLLLTTHWKCTVSTSAPGMPGGKTACQWSALCQVCLDSFAPLDPETWAGHAHRPGLPGQALCPQAL